MNSCVERIRIAVCEHPLQTRVLKHPGNLLDFSFNCFGYEETVLFKRALVLVFFRLISTVPHLRLRSHCDDEFSVGHDVLMLDVTFGICLTVESYLLDVAVLIAVAFCNDPECSSGNLDLSIVEERRSEPVAS